MFLDTNNKFHYFVPHLLQEERLCGMVIECVASAAKLGIIFQATDCISKSGGILASAQEAGFAGNGVTPQQCGRAINQATGEAVYSTASQATTPDGE